MAISVLEVGDGFALRHVRLSAAPTAVRRLPVAIVGAATVGVLEAVALLAVALGSLDGALSPGATPGWLIAGGLVVLAAWVVLCAGSAAALVDGSGRSLLTAVSCAETALVAFLLVLATVTPFANPTPLSVPALGLLALAVPVGKLLLAGAPSARAWLAQGPRARVRRPDAVQAHRGLATATLGVIGLALFAVALLAPVPSGDVQEPASAVFAQD